MFFYATIKAKRYAQRAAIISAVCSTATLLSSAALAGGSFVEGDVTVLHAFSDPGGFYGWGVADLTDISNPPDGVKEIIIPTTGGARVDVIDGATGSVIWALSPPPVPAAPTQFGFAVADAGDVDNDGVHDIIVGARNSGPTYTGAAHVFSGATGLLLYTFEGVDNGEGFGQGVASAGDVNGDNHADLLVGANNSPVGGASSGRGYIFSGADGSLIRHLDAQAPGDALGSGTALAGFIDDDDVPDQILGAPGGGSFGRADVFSGADGSLIFSVSSPFGGGAYGTFFVAGVGDVNGDTRDDVYVGDYAARSGAGAAYVYSGVDGSLIHDFRGSAGEGVGPGRQAGDVDGDGFVDLLIGHYTNGDGASQAGRVTVRSGRTGSILRTITSTTPGEQLGFDCVGVGDTNGDGLIDLLLSAASGSNVYLVAGNEFVCPEAAAPIAEASGVLPGRYLGIQGEDGIATALRVTLTDLPQFPASEGETRWVGPPLQYDAGGGETFRAAQLQCEPFYRNWGPVGTVWVYGEDVVPGSSYAVQSVALECNPADEALFSSVLNTSTGLWGDVAPPFDAEQISDQPDINDILAVVDTFLALPLAPPRNRAQLNGDTIDPAKKPDLADILDCVDALLGKAYPEDGPGTCGP